MEKNKVKQKFDDLFCASKYNKALSEIKDQKKKLTQQVRETRLKLEEIQTRKSQADEFKQTLVNYEKELTNADKEISQFKEQISKETKELDNYNSKEKEARETLKKIDNLRSERKVLLKQNIAFEKKLQEEYLETDEELENLRINFSDELSKFQSKKQNASKELNNLKSKKKSFSSNISNLDRKLNSIEAKLNSAKNYQLNRDDAIRKITIEFKIDGLNNIINDESYIIQSDDIVKFVQKITLKLSELSNNIKNARLNTEILNNDFAEESGKLTSNISTISSTINSSKKKINQNENDIKLCNSSIEKNTKLISQMEKYEKFIKEKENELNEMKSEMEIEEYDKKISNLNDEKENIEKEMKKVSDNISIITKNTSILSKIDASKSNINDLKISYSEKFKKLIDNLNTLTDTNIIISDEINDNNSIMNINPSNIEKEYLSQIQTEKTALRLLDDKLKKSRKNFSDINGKLNANNESLDKLKTKLKKHQKSLSNLSSSLPDLIKECEKTIQIHQRDISMAKSAEIIYQDFIERGTEDKECPLCERSMEENALSSLMEKLSIDRKKAPEKIIEFKKELKKSQNNLENLQRLLPDWNEVERINSEIPNLEELKLSLKKKYEEYDNELKEIEIKHKNLTEKINSLNTNYSYFSGSGGIISEYKRYLKLIKSIEELKNSLPNEYENFGDLSLEDTTKKYEELRNNNTNISKKITELRNKEKICEKSITNCLNSINSTREKLLNATNSSQEIERQRNKINTLKKENNDILEEIKLKKEEHDKLSINLEKLKEKYSKEKKSNENIEKELQKSKDLFSSKVISVKNSITQAEEYSIDDLSKEYNEIKEKKDEFEKELLELENNIKEQENIIHNAQVKLETSESAKRNLDDNISFRKQKKEIELLTEKIENLEEKSNNNNNGAKNILNEKTRIEKSLKNVTSKFEKLSGMKQVYEAQAKKLVHDLGKPIYQTVDKEFKQTLVTLNSNIMAIDDLDRYYKALDKAIMQYHAMKIEEINKILKELWQSTYKGADIDSIELRADIEGSRSYNYRLLMIKGDSELDMRGRCSAGQKVLASLVIRLALAESLGVNCGIIALDEPTTNLDRENVESFASALVE